MKLNVIRGSGLSLKCGALHRAPSNAEADDTIDVIQGCKECAGFIDDMESDELEVFSCSQQRKVYILFKGAGPCGLLVLSISSIYTLLPSGF